MGRSGAGEKRIGITVRFHEDVLKRLNDFCRMHYDCDRSKVVEEAVEKFLEEETK